MQLALPHVKKQLQAKKEKIRDVTFALQKSGTHYKFFIRREVEKIDLRSQHHNPSLTRVFFKPNLPSYG